jgi:hypothetical protein
MFSKLFSKNDKATKPKTPEIMGLYLGGSFELDPLKLRLIEPELMIEKAASHHLIQAIGEVNLDTGGKILRFYTDDDAYLQVILDGGDTENHITDVKLWYFYETKTIGSDVQWKQIIASGVSKPTYQLEDVQYQRVWDAVGDDGDTSETDQFVMLYERKLEGGETETLLVTAEEKLIDKNFDRCLVISTGFNIGQADITING